MTESVEVLPNVLYDYNCQVRGEIIGLAIKEPLIKLLKNKVEEIKIFKKTIKYKKELEYKITKDGKYKYEITKDFVVLHNPPSKYDFIMDKHFLNLIDEQVKGLENILETVKNKEENEFPHKEWQLKKVLLKFLHHNVMLLFTDSIGKTLIGYICGNCRSFYNKPEFNLKNFEEETLPLSMKARRSILSCPKCDVELFFNSKIYDTKPGIYI